MAISCSAGEGVGKGAHGMMCTLSAVFITVAMPLKSISRLA
jgi:hypothetical protein